MLDCTLGRDVPASFRVQVLTDSGRIWLGCHSRKYCGFWKQTFTCREHTIGLAIEATREGTSCTLKFQTNLLYPILQVKGHPIAYLRISILLENTSFFRFRKLASKNFGSNFTNTKAHVSLEAPRHGLENFWFLFFFLFRLANQNSSLFPWYPQKQCFGWYSAQSLLSNRYLVSTR